jgi:hypothetical protein
MVGKQPVKRISQRCVGVSDGGNPVMLDTSRLVDLRVTRDRAPLHFPGQMVNEGCSDRQQSVKAEMTKQP